MSQCVNGLKQVSSAAHQPELLLRFWGITAALVQQFYIHREALVRPAVTNLNTQHLTAIRNVEKGKAERSGVALWVPSVQCLYWREQLPANNGQAETGQYRQRLQEPSAAQQSAVIAEEDRAAW